jgi:1-pyrroline-5-carboxylate dehydrogenase
MSTGIFSYPPPINEPVKSYAPGTPERAALKKALTEMKKKTWDIPMYIGGKAVRTGNKKSIHPPHEISHTLGHFHAGEAKHAQQAVDSALKARKSWSAMSWESRAHIFLKAADLLAGKYRYQMNAATMLGQSKNAFQAEIDSACELIDFLRFNVYYLNEIYKQQPVSSPGIHNRMEWRPLEGFVLAITPFNFTAIGGNLPTSAALCGNVVVWKPANTQIFSAQLFMRILQEAGLPDGVINLVYVDGPTIGKTCFTHPLFAGVHFTGSTGVFNQMWKTMAENLPRYRSYPRIVGETGGKDFVLVHKSADPDVVVTALARGAFEFQGQKCSAASRAYIPSNLAAEIKRKLVAEINTMKMGSVEDFSHFINAVIDEKAYDNITSYIRRAVKNKKNTLLAGGTFSKKKGYFIAPTLIESKDPRSLTMCEEIFGPVLTLHVYPADNFDRALELVDTTSPYALTGSVIARDRQAIEKATIALRDSAGNFYINDKPTGAVVGQQPFGGARASGTNDKAGSQLNLYRWLSARTIKETFDPPTDYKYPFMQEG